MRAIQANPVRVVRNYAMVVLVVVVVGGVILTPGQRRASREPAAKPVAEQVAQRA